MSPNKSLLSRLADRLGLAVILAVLMCAAMPWSAEGETR